MHGLEIFFYGSKTHTEACQFHAYNSTETLIHIRFHFDSKGKIFRKRYKDVGLVTRNYDTTCTVQIP